MVFVKKNSLVATMIPVSETYCITEIKTPIYCKGQELSMYIFLHQMGEELQTKMIIP
jgi:hypothetical protein